MQIGIMIKSGETTKVFGSVIKNAFNQLTRENYLQRQFTKFVIRKFSHIKRETSLLHEFYDELNSKCQKP